MILDERRLAVRIRAGEPQAFRELYDAYGARVLGYALRLTGVREEAEDLVQEVFVAAYSGRAAFEGRARLISWLLGIATRRWRDRARSESAARHGSGRRPTATEFLEDVAYDPGIERGVVDGMTLEHVLGRLDPPFREALLLVRSQGLTYAEAAGITGEPEGTVKWRVAEATRRALKIFDRMDGEFHEPDGMQREPAGTDSRPCSR